jgi:hypothetical protein
MPEENLNSALDGRPKAIKSKKSPGSLPDVEICFPVTGKNETMGMPSADTNYFSFRKSRCC